MFFLLLLADDDERAFLQRLRKGGTLPPRAHPGEPREFRWDFLQFCPDKPLRKFGK